MAKIQIYGDTNKGCIFFDGSRVEPKFLGTIVASVKADETDRIVIERTDAFRRDGVTFRTLFRRLKATRVQNRDGQNLIDDLGYSVADVVVYINGEASNYSASVAVRPSLDEHPNFVLDPTSTTIMVDNGENYGVNTLKAVLGEDGLIDIVSSDHSGNAITYYEDCPHENLQINGQTISGGPNDVVNALNELFTVGAFEQVVINDPYATMLADVNGTATTWNRVGNQSEDPDGADLAGAIAGNTNRAGVRTIDTIDQPGEYFTFDLRRKSTYGMGLINVNDSDGIGAEDTFCDGSGSYAQGFQWSQWLHSSHGFAWTLYGENSGYSMKSGWGQFNGSDEHTALLADGNVKFRVGVDENSFIHCDWYDVSESSWKRFSQSSYPVTEGSEFALGIKIGDAQGRLFSAPKVHLREPEAPVMYFRYIESGDGNYHYPLFATLEEAKYYHKVVAGVSEGEAHSHVYPDDPTGTTWYMPENGQMAGTGAPYNMVFDGQTVLFTEITSLTDADLAPPTYSSYDLTIDEGESIIHQTQPMDTWYTTTFANLPTGLVDMGAGMIGGTAPEVTGDNVANPSDTYVVDVIRTNSYGNSTGQLTIVVNNLTPPATLPSGFTQTAGGLNGDGTLAAGGVVTLDDTLASGKRLVVPKTWVEANVLPYTTSSLEKAYVAVPAPNANWGTVELHNDFDAVMRWEGQSGNAHKSTLADGSDIIARSENSVGSATNAHYNYAIQWDGTDLVVMADTDLSKLNNEHDYTQMERYSAYENYAEQSGALPLVMAAKTGGAVNLELLGLSFVDIPAAPVTNLTPWTKALDFSGSSERAQQVSTSSAVNPMMMNGLSVLTSGPSSAGMTSNNAYSRPWATACVFKYDRNNSNQHIWNQGEGVGGDNIYLRMSASGYLYFGWGRDGAGVNECTLGGVLSTDKWFGVYVAHNGHRLSSSNATAANLASAFDIYLMRMNDAGTQWTTRIGTMTDAEGNRSIASNWDTTGYRMDRSNVGGLTIGGRGSNRSFHGKVASMVVTTLRKNVNMPTKEEAEMMITDPKQWEDVYRVGQQVRNGNSGSNSTYNPANIVSGYGCTQIWLMGDGQYDNYSNMIRNQVYPQDQNYTKLNLISMVSNDIQNVNINGLS